MTVPGNIDTLLLGGQRGYQIERSLRFNKPDSAYLNRTPASAGNRRTWTWSGWVKRSALGVHSTLLHAYDGSSSRRAQFYFNTSNQFEMNQGGGGTTAIGTTTAVFRDTSAWYHILFYADYTNTTFKLYVNNVEQTISYSSSVINADGQINAAIAHQIGGDDGSGAYFPGYMAEVHFVDGQALTPSSFGETDTITGVWKPKRYSGTYGTNGFYLKFADNSGTTSTTLGKDSSGNGNNWTPNNFSVTAGAGNDSLIDTPTPYADGGNGRGNYCTLNSILKFYGSGSSITDGSLNFISNTAGVTESAFATIPMPSGKWYAEVTITAAVTAQWVGVCSNLASAGYAGGFYGVRNPGYAYKVNTGNKCNNDNTGTAYAASSTTGDIIGIAMDASAGSITFYKNGTSLGTAFTGMTNSGGGWVFGGDSDPGGTLTWNFGQRAFSYTPPAGFLALNTQNLPEPSIKKPSSYFDTLLYTGNSATSSAGTTARTLTGLGFQPDLIWVKSRNNGGTWSDHSLTDTVRGANLSLSSNTLGAETNVSTAFLNGGVGTSTSDGFTIISGTAGTTNNLNSSSGTYVAWCWDKSATPGFDIVTYTGDGVSNRTVSHGLGVVPAMIIIKDRDTNSNANNWFVWHQSLSSGNNIQLGNTDAAYTVSSGTSGGGIGTSPTSSTFTLLNGTSSNVNTNENGDRFVAYLWSEVAGFSKFGSYTGNGSSDGPFVFCGFRPAFVMVKNASDTGGRNWGIVDNKRGSYNSNDYHLIPNTAEVENNSNPAGTYAVDFLSNGFKVRNTTGVWNGSSNTIIFAAFAESPAKYSLAR